MKRANCSRYCRLIRMRGRQRHRVPVRSQAKQQVLNGGWLGQERVVASVELDDGAGLAGEVALQPRWRALVLGADEIGRGHLLPGRRTYGLCRHVHALPRELVCSLGLGVGVAVLQERLHEELRADTERAAVRVDVEERGGCAIAEVGEALPDLGGGAG